MSVPGIEAVGFTPLVAPQVPATAVTAGAGSTPATGTSGVTRTDTGFGNLVLDGLDKLEGLNDRTDSLAVKAATGDLSNIHDYTIAATESSVAMQMTVAVRNKALEAFNEIMRMPI